MENKTEKDLKEIKEIISIISLWLISIILIIGILCLFLLPVDIDTKINCSSGNIDLNLSFSELNKTTIQNINNLGCNIEMSYRGSITSFFKIIE